MASNVKLVKALERVKKWMREHDAPLLVDNLADGAPASRLDEVARKLGFPLPGDLRDLWALHDGQHEELNGFVGALDLLSTSHSLGERETVKIFVELLREDPSSWKDAGVTEDEAKSDHWVPFAGRDSDLLIVSGVSGRVFTCGKDAPPLQLVARSVTEWAEQYANRVEAGEYEVEEGFGDYYLSHPNSMH